jgi:hypothetical protein
MKCHSLRDAIVEWARGQDLGPGTLAAVESHVDHCRSCAALMARERQLSQGLRALAATTAADGSSDAVGRRLLEIFAERQGAGQPAASPTVNRAWRTPWLRVAAALVVTAALVASWRSVRTEPGSDDPAAPKAAPAVASNPVPSPPPEAERTSLARGTEPDVQAGAGRAPNAGRRLRAVAPSLIRPVGFVELPGAAGLPDFESGQIIRMEIPLTSLPTYGIEILPDAQGSPVEADLLVGQDGQARAIRLVTAGAGS